MMGAQQSSRRVTIDNEEPNNVIKLSEKVVERLKGSIVKEDVSPARTSVKQPAPVFVDQNSYEKTQRPSDNEIRAQYEEVIKQNNQYWENKVKSLMENHFKIDDIYDSEYKKALKDVEENFPRSPIKNPTVPCQDKKQVVLECYQKNKGQPLLCAREVQDFSNCMCNTRVKLQADGKLT
ncbi:hypothetical protein LSTR_LSTR007297 [Laodelphax striatellus]|uniref:CHCH domain-containing protein n=1 Tax=Laodelphax striatellus TaxID=195883 RepID=A0A482XDF7_LAOST|nr:hypothetical protein LSTR_LSTR007297 [Laodelphax striatellus]